MKLFIKILSWLIHHANRQGKNEYFYKIKNAVLAKYGRNIGYDIQFIEGKKCWSCGGTGWFDKYNFWRDEEYSEPCFKCDNGWYKRPVWVILAKIKLGKYEFHQPKERVYSKPDNGIPVIDGYITHTPSKYGKFALFVLFMIYEKGYLKRWYKSEGLGWERQWWIPANFIYNSIHIIKHGSGSIPFIRYKNKIRMKQINKNIVQATISDDLPF